MDFDPWVGQTHPLGGTTTNVTLWKFETCPTLEQHKIHFLKKSFENLFQKIIQVMKIYFKRLFKSWKFISKDYSSHENFESSIGFMKSLILIFQMSGQGKVSGK
jgi:hypothetical protein